MILYSTVIDEAVSEQIIEKSRFIAHVKPAKTRKEADEFIARIRKKHNNATHNVPAMVIGDKQQIQWASDDGEPQGTSGAPIVQMLVREGITNVAVVVTRYFGGVKLGTGGLVRAYTGSVKAAVEKAGICDVKEMYELTYELDYGDFNKTVNHIFPFKTKITDISYTDKITFRIICSPDDRETLKGIMCDLSKGSAAISDERYGYEKVSRV